MTTKHRILSVLTVLALVASLTAVTAAPAAATPGGAVVSVTPTTALATANYTISFFAPAAIPAGGAFSVTFPTTTGNLTALAAAPLPGPAANLTVAGVTVNITDIADIGMTIAVTIAANITAGSAVVLWLSGITNPGPGRHTLTVAGITSAIYSIHGLARTPASGAPGTMVTLSGLAHDPGAPGTLAANVTGVITPVVFTTDAVGTIPPTVVPILAGAPAVNVTFIATVGVRTYTSPIFTVIAAPLPTITLVSPVPPHLPMTSGPRGATVTVNGSGFPLVVAPGIITAPGVITPVTFSTTAAGAFTTNVTIVGDAPFGLQTITATVGILSASAHFIVDPPAPTITLSPTSGARSMNVTVTGHGFPPGLGGVIVAPGVIAPIGIDPPVAANGTFSEIITIRDDAPFGVATITATVGVVSDDATFTVRFPEIHVVAPKGGVPGASVNISVRGFWPATHLTITSPGVISPHRAMTDAAGAFSYIATILIGAPSGAATITATSDDPPAIRTVVTAMATYTVGIPASITLTPAMGFPGTKVTVSGFGFPIGTTGTITAPGVIVTETFTTTTAGTIHAITGIPAAVDPVAPVTILPGAPVGPATITVTVGAVTATAVFTVAGPGVPIIVPEPVVPILKGLEVIRKQLGESVWHFRAGNWYQFHTDPAKHALIPLPRRLGELRSGEAYWIYLEKPITDVLVGGVRRTLPAGWHNIGWVL